MNQSTHPAGTSVKSASATNTHALPSSQPAGVRSLMATVRVCQPPAGISTIRRVDAA